MSFPFPKEASEIVKGDYANTSIRLDINLENILPNGEEGGGLPPILPDPGEVAQTRSGSACAAATSGARPA